MKEFNIKDSDVDRLHKKLSEEAEESGYHLNPDVAFAKELTRSILINEKRYEYGACPCRLASAIKEEDLDIICPCNYRDADLNQFGSCFCGLYVSDDVFQGKRRVNSIPERRPTKEDRDKMKDEKMKLVETKSNVKITVWRCKVCGYLCARDEPPEVCPICKAKDRFERFM